MPARLHPNSSGARVLLVAGRGYRARVSASIHQLQPTRLHADDMWLTGQPG